MFTLDFPVSDLVGGQWPDLLKCSYSVEFLIPEILLDDFEHLNRGKLGTTELEEDGRLLLISFS